MSERSHYLPRTSVIEKLSSYNQGELLGWHYGDVTRQISDLKSGRMFFSEGKGARHHHRLLKAKLNRVVKMALHFGHTLSVAGEAA